MDVVNSPVKYFSLLCGTYLMQPFKYFYLKNTRKPCLCHCIAKNFTLLKVTPLMQPLEIFLYLKVRPWCTNRKCSFTLSHVLNGTIEHFPLLEWASLIQPSQFPLLCRTTLMQPLKYLWLKNDQEPCLCHYISMNFTLLWGTSLMKPSNFVFTKRYVFNVTNEHFPLLKWTSIIQPSIFFLYLVAKT